jgi:hypothetical protein
VDYDTLPGYEVIREGLQDLLQDRNSAAALLVVIGAERLRRAGLDVPPRSMASPEHELYAMLASEDADSAHSRYNALIRQLVSFERAAECAV